MLMHGFNIYAHHSSEHDLAIKSCEEFIQKARSDINIIEFSGISLSHEECGSALFGFDDSEKSSPEYKKFNKKVQELLDSKCFKGKGSLGSFYCYERAIAYLGEDSAILNQTPYSSKDAKKMAWHALTPKLEQCQSTKNYASEECKEFVDWIHQGNYYSAIINVLSEEMKAARIEFFDAAKDSCKNGNAEFCLKLGHWQKNDKYGMRDHKAAYGYLKKSCELGEPKGCHSMALIYQTGEPDWVVAANDENKFDFVELSNQKAAEYYDNACQLSSNKGRDLIPNPCKQKNAIQMSLTDTLDWIGDTLINNKIVAHYEYQNCDIGIEHWRGNKGYVEKGFLETPCCGVPQEVKNTAPYGVRWLEFYDRNSKAFYKVDSAIVELNKLEVANSKTDVSAKSKDYDFLYLRGLELDLIGIAISEPASGGSLRSRLVVHNPENLPETKFRNMTASGSSFVGAFGLYIPKRYDHLSQPLANAFMHAARLCQTQDIELETSPF